MKRTYNLKTSLVCALRKVWRFWPVRLQVLREAEVKRADGTKRYKCAITGKLFPKDEVQVDHIKPICVNGFPTVSIDVNCGYGIRLEDVEDWNCYIYRMFCDKANLQVVSKKAHKEKTKHETKTRKVAR